MTSVAGGSYVVRSLASKTVGRLAIDADAAPPLLKVTTYSFGGAERDAEAPLASVLPLSKPGDASRLRTFSFPQDTERPYLVLVEPGAVLDAAAFDAVTAGVAPPGAGPPRRRRRRRKRR